MATAVKTVVATGASSGLGFEAVKQLLRQAQPYKFILGARDTNKTRAAYDELGFDTATHTVSILPLDLTDLRGVKTFAQQTLSKLGRDKLDVLFLNAGMAKAANGRGPQGSKWCHAYVVNHLSQHYLIHLLREKLVASQSRLVVVSSGVVRNLRDSDPTTLDSDLRANSGADGRVTYSASKFAQLLGAHYWRRQLGDSCNVVAVSPGLIPDTGINRNGAVPGITKAAPDAKTVEEGAQSLLAAFTRDDFPEDPEQIFLTSWGEWWPKDVYEPSLDKALQDKWCPSKETIERDEVKEEENPNDAFFNLRPRP